MLTRKQRDLLLYIHASVREHGVPPSYDEMREALDLRSKSGVHRLIGSLEERGFVRRLPNKARAVEILRLPEGGGGAPMQAGPRASASPTPLRALASAPAGPAGRGVVVTLPLYGRIAAGQPIEALRDEAAEIAVPADLLGPGEHYALEIDGDSMVEAGILDGDIALIQSRSMARPGEIVVALVRGEDVTLKTFRQRDGLVGLEPANSRYVTRWLEPDQVQVQGRLAGIWRRYL